MASVRRVSGCFHGPPLAPTTWELGSQALAGPLRGPGRWPTAGPGPLTPEPRRIGPALGSFEAADLAPWAQDRGGAGIDAELDGGAAGFWMLRTAPAGPNRRRWSPDI